MKQAKVIITGGPHTGKTSLFNAIKGQHPDLGFVPEPAESVLTATGDFTLLNDPLRFCTSCIRFSAFAEKVSEGKGVTVQDRSLIDTIAYARRDGCEELLPELRSLIAAARYSLALECAFVGDYAKTEIRTEDQETAAATHALIMQAYHELGIPVRKLPAVSVPERVDLAMGYISELTNGSGMDPTSLKW
jgi:predicted ATPase